VKIAEKTLQEAAKASGISVTTIRHRLEQGMTLEEAIAAPRKKPGSKTNGWRRTPLQLRRV
jgi:hypothetical protein